MSALPHYLHQQQRRTPKPTIPAIISVVIVAAFVVPAVLIVAEYDWLQNTLGVRSLIAWSVIAGLIAAAGLSRVIPPAPDHLGYDTWVVRGVVAIPCILVSIGIGSLSGRLLATGHIERDFSVVSKEYYEAGYRSPAEWLITVRLDDTTESLKIDSATFSAIQPGDVYRVRVTVSRWGHQIVPPPLPSS